MRVCWGARAFSGSHMRCSEGNGAQLPKSKGTVATTQLWAVAPEMAGDSPRGDSVVLHRH